MDTLRAMWLRGGAQALFAGNLYNCMRFVPFSGAFAIAYPIIADKLEPGFRFVRRRARGWFRSHLSAEEAAIASAALPSPALLARNGSVAVSAAIAFPLGYPLEVARLGAALRRPLRSGGVVHTGMGMVRRMMSLRGPLAMFRGVWLTAAWVVPSIALQHWAFHTALFRASAFQDWRPGAEAFIGSAIVAAAFAIVLLYPIDTVRK